MVISGYLEDKLNEKRKRDAARRKVEEEKRIAEAVETAVAEAVETAKAETAISIIEAHQAWANWNRRRMEADEGGAPFDEPPPEIPKETGEPR